MWPSNIKGKRSTIGITFYNLNPEDLYMIHVTLKKFEFLFINTEDRYDFENLYICIVSNHFFCLLLFSVIHRIQLFGHVSIKQTIQSKNYH